MPIPRCRRQSETLITVETTQKLTERSTPAVPSSNKVRGTHYTSCSEEQDGTVDVAFFFNHVVPKDGLGRNLSRPNRSNRTVCEDLGQGRGEEAKCRKLLVLPWARQGQERGELRK
ncbi:hypothetical protein NDU88_005994 [Pleurodeles waltl]|uniref:Uncharacterized protein n=1 Tax=Pleurodeles waltl TaxID=8319 RepID=A0AAV7RMP1_PLEWA|nr:hypothetical protein NDU88_005994 [Pleurodeles waltl]